MMNNTMHAATKGSKYANVKSIKLNKTKVSIKVKKKFKLKAEQVKTDKKLKKHRDIEFESSNPKVAVVSKKGVITAKKKGKCTIYVYAQNGVYKKVNVTVKK